MKHWLKHIFKKKDIPPTDHLENASESQSLRLALNTCEEEILRLQAEIQRLRSQQILNTEARLESNLNILVSHIAQPLVQLQAQFHLQEKGVAVSIDNLKHLTHQLIKKLEKSGITLFGTFDESVPFDPACHRALSAQRAFKPGDPVVVQIQGVRIKNEVMHQALVSAPQKQNNQKKDETTHARKIGD